MTTCGAAAAQIICTTGCASTPSAVQWRTRSSLAIPAGGIRPGLEQRRLADLRSLCRVERWDGSESEGSRQLTSLGRASGERDSRFGAR
jgi:hypothetical protein